MFKQGDSRPCTKLGIQERGTELGELGEKSQISKHDGISPSSFYGQLPDY